MQAAVDSPPELKDFDELVRLHWPRVYRFLLASLRDPDAAQTLTQDCFLRAWRSQAGFRGESSARTWLMQIALNLARDYSRSRRLRFWSRLGASAVAPGDVSDYLPDGAASPEEQAARKEQVQTIGRVCRALPERQRTVFLLRFVEELDLLEIAAVTGIKEGTVKAHLARAVQTVRNKLGRSK